MNTTSSLIAVNLLLALASIFAFALLAACTHAAAG